MEASPRVIGIPRVVLGMPAYNRPDVLARTLESLLSQTYQDFALVIVDDCPSTEVSTIVEPYARAYPRVTYEAHSARLGMVGNWRKVFERSRQLYPGSPYFAWVSDHDLWHARWLQEMVAVLDANPAVVLAYPESLRMVPDGARKTNRSFETFGMTGRGLRMRRSARHMLSGEMIYGLVRADALEAAGVFRHVVTPDRQVLLALSLFGEVKQVREVLWYREFVRVFDVGRQREVFFPGGAPLYIYLPSHLQHFATLVWDYVIRGRGRPAFGRLAALWYAALQLWFSIVRDVVRPKSEWRVAIGKYAPHRWLATAFRSAGAAPADADAMIERTLRD
jgi:glycosyltransferase involved in cell wall biosynthesis